MTFRQYLPLIALAILPSLSAQFGGKKVMLRRALPPSVALDAKSFNIVATSQDAASQPVAASFQELFKAKIQGDERFIYNNANPALRMAITVTRFYIESKQAQEGKTTCTTHLGHLQGSFSVIESDTGRPVASDTLGWKLTNNDSRHVLVSDDGREVSIDGPARRLSAAEMREKAGEESVTQKIGIRNPLNRNSPCDVPFSQNEARDSLADVFLTDIIHMATPYTVPLEIKVPGDKVFRDSVEEMEAKRWSKSLDLLIATKEQPKPNDEAKRLFLTGLAYESLGYLQGERSNEISEGIRAGKSQAELDNVRQELKKTQDTAKEYFEKAAKQFSKAKMLDDDEKDYRAAERRADEAYKLYVRIQKYREMKPEIVAAPQPVAVSMAEVVGMCMQGVAEVIIIDRIETAPEISATRAQASELAKCGEKQGAVFTALKKRWDRTSVPAKAPPVEEVKPPTAAPTKPPPAAPKPKPISVAKPKPTNAK
jgi:hypothetical protein